MTSLHLPDAKRLVSRSIRICVRQGWTEAQACAVILIIIKRTVDDNPDLTPELLRWAAEINSAALVALYSAPRAAPRAG
jgi:hypothetical protein